jgi:hypothetical protein
MNPDTISDQHIEIHLLEVKITSVIHSHSLLTDIRGGFSIRSSTRVYENPWIHVREDQVIRADGKNGIYGVITMKNWALGVVPLFSDGTVLLVGQHRYPLNEYLLYFT